jgi:hypothetical protein
MVPGVDKRQTPAELCKKKYRRFLGLKGRLRQAAWEFLTQVHKRILAREPDAKLIVDLIAADWQKVRPKTRETKMAFDPFSQATKTFDTGDWSGVDAGGLHLALVTCGEAYVTVHSFYNRLLPEEKEEAIPGGLNP